MGRKCASCQKDLHLVEEVIMGYCTHCVKTGKTPANEKSEKGEKSKTEVQDLDNVEPRILELMEKLKSLGEAVK